MSYAQALSQRYAALLAPFMRRDTAASVSAVQIGDSASSSTGSSGGDQAFDPQQQRRPATHFVPPLASAAATPYATAPSTQRQQPALINLSPPAQPQSVEQLAAQLRHALQVVQNDRDMLAMKEETVCVINLM